MIDRYPLQIATDSYNEIDSEPTAMRGLKPAMAATTTALGLIFWCREVMLKQAKEEADSGCCFAGVVIQTETD